MSYYDTLTIDMPMPSAMDLRGVVYGCKSFTPDSAHLHVDGDGEITILERGDYEDNGYDEKGIATKTEAWIWTDTGAGGKPIDYRHFKLLLENGYVKSILEL